MEYPQAYCEKWRVSRKTHKCCECRGIIFYKERYLYCSGVWDSRGDSYKTCSDCAELRDAINRDNLSSKTIFYSYYEFHNHKIYCCTNGAQFRNLNLDPEYNNIILISKQLIQNYVCEDKINLDIGLLIYDETHFGGTTEISDKIIERQKYVF